MVKNYLFRTLCCLMLLTGISYTALAVAESEPNNTWNTADVITLGATGTGTAGIPQEQDWWQVTSTENGKLTVSFTSTNGTYFNCNVYDNGGTIFFAGSYTAGTNSVNVDGLAAGTYYIQIFAYYGGQTATYSFTPTWTAPAQANDVEPNGTRNQAKVLNLNGSKTGHIDYYHNNSRDTLDWFKVTTIQNGRLSISITSHNGHNVFAELFDNNGTIYLGGGFTASTGTWNIDGLAKGTYYIRIRTYYNNGFAPYTISNTFLNAPVAEDAEFNDVYTTAVTASLNDTLTGHVNYYYNNYRDTLDWFKITTTTDGYVSFYIQSMNGQNVFMQMFDANGTTFLGGSYTSSNNTFTVDGVAAGTYYFRIRTFYNNEFVPYRFSIKVTPPTYLNDVEPNNTVATAKTITKNDSITGHIGYYANNYRDTFDYRKLTLTEYGSLSFKIYSGNGQNVYALLYDADGTTYLAGSYTSSVNQWSRADMAPGTYYLRINNYYLNTEFAPYALKLNFTPVIATDVEPNGTLATAKTINVNTPTYACVGYFNNGVRDTNDWHKVVMPEDGKAVFTLTNNFTNTSNVFLEVYDVNGANQYSQYTHGGTLTFTKANIRKGTYYIRVRGYYNYEFTQYLLTVNFTSTNATDAETNNTASTAKHIAGYTIRNGNIGYNAFGSNTDTVDWHRVGHWGVGPLNLIIKKVANPDAGIPNINFKLYGDTTAAPLYNFDLASDSTNVSYTLAKKVYYIKLTQLGGTYGGYVITANYRDTCSQQIVVTTHIPDSGCNRGTLVYDVTRGVTPYIVQLYKDGLPSGAPVSTSGTATFNNLDGGVYYATVRSDKANDCEKATSVRAIAGTPLGIQKLTITSTTAVLRWTAQPCVDGFIMAYRIPPSLVFTFDTVPAGKYRDTIFNLTPGTRYRCKIASFVTYDGTTYVGNYSDLFSIITPLRLGDDVTVDTESLIAYPNPANDVIQLTLPTANGTIQITNLVGQVVKTAAVSESFNTQVQVYDLPKGVYIIQYVTPDKSYTTRFIKE
jgi:hypothetical protein